MIAITISISSRVNPSRCFISRPPCRKKPQQQNRERSSRNALRYKRGEPENDRTSAAKGRQNAVHGASRGSANAEDGPSPGGAKKRPAPTVQRCKDAKMQRCKDCAPLLNFLRPGFNAQGWSGWRLLPAHSSWMSCHSRQSPAPSQAPEAEPESRKPKARSL